MKKHKDKKEAVPKGPVGWVCPVCGEGVAPTQASCPKSHGVYTPPPQPYVPLHPPYNPYTYPTYT